MVFVAASLVVLVMFLAYVVDINAVLLARERAQQFARFAALAAIEGYFSKTCTTNDIQCYQSRLNTALSSASDVGSANRLFNAKDSSDGSMQLALSTTSGDTCSDGRCKAKLIPGRWIAVDTNQECNGNPPCFVENIPGSTSANAFKVIGAYKGGITGFFSRAFFGQEFLTFSASAVATVVPRRGMFLVDISPSATFETHPDPAHTKSGEPASAYAFQLNQFNPTWHDSVWGALAISRPAGAVNHRVHYKDDFVSVSPYLDDDFGTQQGWEGRSLRALHPDPSPGSVYSVGDSGAPQYTLDAFRGGTYKGPEPLQTILTGIQGVVAQFKNRAVSGDKAGVIFYDDKFIWPRIIKPTSDFDYVLHLLDNTPDGSEFREYPNQNSPFLNAAKFWLFPRLGAYTNSQGAVMEAVKQLYDDQQSQPGLVTSDFLVMIGDGQSNCYPLDSDGHVVSDYAIGGPTIHYFNCNNTYSGYYYSRLALRAYIRAKVVPKKIPIHVILVGKDSGPNTVDRAKPGITPPQCYTDAELRSLNLPELYAVQGSGPQPPETGWGNDSMDQDWWNAFTNQNQSPFYQASKDMYQIANLTGGIWAPLRDQTDAGGDCENSACSNGQVRTIDPQCRTVEKQIKDAMDTIMGQNPFAIVEVN